MKKFHLILPILLIAASCRKNANTTKTNIPSMNTNIFQPINTIKTDLSMFPVAQPGYKIVAIEVPEKPNEKDFKIEALVGKTQEIDCNYYFMMGTSQNLALDGWGYNYTVVTTNGGVSGTKMGCPENSRKMAFVHLSPLMFDYNSKFPVVIYVPDFCEVKYRIWSANQELYNAIPLPNGSEKKELIRDCPDGKIINAMPSAGENEGEGGPPRVYYIYKGVRKELYEFDEEWVSKNCKVKTTTAY
jgi:ecotin